MSIATSDLNATLIGIASLQGQYAAALVGDIAEQADNAHHMEALALLMNQERCRLCNNPHVFAAWEEHVGAFVICNPCAGFIHDLGGTLSIASPRVLAQLDR